MLTSVDRLLFIRSVPIFKELRDDFLVRLASVMDEMTFASNYPIITEGHEGRALYIVVSGRVSVHLRGQELAQLDQNACFGEMSVFDAEPRSASVTTLEPCNCLVLTQQQLYEAIDETPGIAVNIIRLLSRRIRELNRDLNQRQQELQALQRGPLPYLQESPVPTETQRHAQENGQVELPSPRGYFPYGQVPY
ncbi:MAG: Crp/Fnr family transcriptional regulator [Cyanobacteria bacterium Co-bin13]|nr:Crp/Fnr family transcriptional regulator [Cyanobacteria bacterium Co-bin13]